MSFSAIKKGKFRISGRKVKLKFRRKLEENPNKGLIKAFDKSKPVKILVNGKKFTVEPKLIHYSALITMAFKGEIPKSKRPTYPRITYSYPDKSWESGKLVGTMSCVCSLEPRKGLEVTVAKRDYAYEGY